MLQVHAYVSAGPRTRGTQLGPGVAARAPQIGSLASPRPGPQLGPGPGISRMASAPVRRGPQLGPGPALSARGPQLGPGPYGPLMLPSNAPIIMGDLPAETPGGGITRRTRRASSVGFNLDGETRTRRATSSFCMAGAPAAAVLSPPRTLSIANPKAEEMLAFMRSCIWPELQGQIVEEGNGMIVRKSVLPGSDGVMMPRVCLSFKIPDFPAHIPYNFMKDKAGSLKWHKDVATITECTASLGAQASVQDDEGRGNPGSGGTSLRLWHSTYKIPAFAKFLGFPPREVLEYRTCIACLPEAYYIISSSTGTEGLGVPVAAGHKRAHLTAGATAFIPLPEGGCEMRSVTHMNPQQVPMWILDKIATSKPKEFCEQLMCCLRGLPPPPQY